MSLLTGATDAGSRVHETRMLPFKKAELPAISVYALSETIDSDSRTVSPREYRRDLTLAIDVVARAADDCDDDLDDIATQIEDAMHVDATLGGVCSDAFLMSTEIGISTETDQHVGVLTLTYSVEYFTDIPTADLDDWELLHVEHEGSDADHEDDRAKDDVDMT